jgi:molecular chaperone DnaK
VHAKDTATGKEQKITITASSGLSESEIQQMVKDAAEHEAEDKVRRGEIERRNKLDSLCFTLEKTVTENRAKQDAADVASLDAAILAGREAVEKQDDVMIKAATERLEKESQRVGSAMYQGATGGATAPGNEGAGDGPAAGTAAGAGAGKPSTKNVVDAEFEDSPHP